MHMIRVWAAGSGLLAALSGFATPTLPAPDLLAVSSAPATGDWRSLIDALAAHPEILTKDWAAVRAILPPGCFRDANSGDVACPPLEGVQRLSVVPGPQGLVHLVLKAPPVGCDLLYDVLSKRFGRGELENGNPCVAAWKIGKWVKRGHVNYSPGRKDPSQLHVQFAIEQGP